MRVLRLCWLGIPAREYEPMVRLLRDIMGLRVEFEEPTTTELSLPSGDRVQVFAPGNPYFHFFGKHGSGPVALFEVDEIRTAHAELVAAGIEIIGAIERDSNWEWLNFRAPDGNLYELASRRSTTGNKLPRTTTTL
jgi:catechol 2,3-dioxygenase-like lactoylglutathione lyase family enzyme